jgi:hypothetical protein
VSPDGIATAEAQGPPPAVSSTRGNFGFDHVLSIAHRLRHEDWQLWDCLQCSVDERQFRSPRPYRTACLTSGGTITLDLLSKIQRDSTEGAVALWMGTPKTSRPDSVRACGLSIASGIRAF